MKKEKVDIKIPTLKQYLEDLYKVKDFEFPLGYNLFNILQSNIFGEIDKENRFKNERWYQENEPKIKNLLKISIVQTIKIIQYYEQKNKKRK